MAINLDHVTEQITVTDDAANADLTLVTKGTGTVRLNTGSGTSFAAYDAGSTSNYWWSGIGGTFNGILRSTGSTQDGLIQTGGTGGISLQTNNGAQTQFKATHTASAVNYVNLTGSVAGNTAGPIISAQGSDTDVPLSIRTKNAGAMIFTKARSVTTSNTYLFENSGGLFSDGGGGAFWRGLHFGAPLFSISGSNKFPRIANYFELDSTTDPTIKNTYYAIGNSTGTNIEANFSNESGAGFRWRNSASSGPDISFRIAPPLITDRNYLQVAGSATGSSPVLSAQGTDTNIDINLTPKGTGGLVSTINSGSFTVTRNSGNNIMKLTAAGTQNLALQATGGGAVYLKTGDDALTQFVAQHNGSAVNFIQAEGGATGAGVQFTAQGSDTNVPFTIKAKGAQTVTLGNGNIYNAFEVEGVPSSVNYARFRSGATGVAPYLLALGADANINLNFVPKGTGNVQQNGTNLALSTHKYHAFSVGTYYFDTYEQSNYFRLFTQNATSDTVRYKTVSSPEYYDYGTSTWTAWPAGQSGIQDLLDGNPATGINVAHANRTFRFVVSGVDGWPTNALVLLETTWSAIAYTTATVTIASSTVIGGPFTSRQVMVFSGANTGNNWGMHSYFTGSIHTGDTFYRITIDLTDWVDVSTYTTYPLRNFSIFSNYSTTGGMVPYVTTFGKNSSFIGGITTGTDANGTFGIGRYNSSDTNAYLDAIGNASGMFQRVNYSPTTRLAYTASSVNYLQFAGSVTGFGPIVSAQGSDTNIPLVLQPKGTGALQAQQTDSTATGGNARGGNAVDWQTLRSTNTMVASGQASVLVGGQNNSSTSYTSFVGAGANNTASGPNSAIVAGNASFASGQWSFIGSGNGNTAGGYYNFIGGGQANSATSASAVTTQSGTMNGTTAVTLSGSNASIKVGQYITGTSIAGNTYVAAISGTSLTLSTAATGSSTNTLTFYTPHGVVVGGGNNQATGAYSFIGGGGDAGTAANRNVASGDWSFVGGGVKNVASGVGSVVAGGGYIENSIFGNTASGSSSFIGSGVLNVASGIGAVISGGWQNTANSTLSTVVGGRFGSTRAIVGMIVLPACSEPITPALGASQAGVLILARQTTDATPTVLRSDLAAASTTNQVILPNNSAYYFRGEVVAGVTGGGNTKGWTIEGVIKRGANAASTALVGTPTVTSSYADAGASTWTIAVTADTTNGGLAVTFTGQASTTIRCVAQIRTTEMTF
jgi:hypothetical protein